MTLPSFYDSTHLYFITASIIGWKHLFIQDDDTNIPINSFAWLQQQKRILLFAFVIMPSHLHAILKPESHPIGEILQQFGSFTAHEILKKLREQSETELLHMFEKQKRDQRYEHSIWQDIQAKIFIQWNSCSKSWNTFTKIRFQRIGSSLKIVQFIHIRAQGIMIMEENQS